MGPLLDGIYYFSFRKNYNYLFNTVNVSILNATAAGSWTVFLLGRLIDEVAIINDKLLTMWFVKTIILWHNAEVHRHIKNRNRNVKMWNLKSSGICHFFLGDISKYSERIARIIFVICTQQMDDDMKCIYVEQIIKILTWPNSSNFLKLMICVAGLIWDYFEKAKIFQ